ncbi:MarR family transcriptional regulator [Rasiella rasia]|uniref:MarR family transcriptional regulator n=1 Tax=Rasiella rasia TaxID=2744027 RepID=A0A6G6GJU6_9FLAO|nr:MarR family transcriptional regulator [Rasiella rasia]QIE58829.1 MarR family transcriptional regulator [Rasiella rasia]
MGDISKDIKSTFQNDKQKAMLNIIYTANWITSKQNSFFKTYSISPQQYNVLRILRGAKKVLPVQTIKDRMLQRAPNATRMMDKLCDKNLIKRVACSNDRRVVQVEITKAGLILLDEIDKAHRTDYLENLSLKEAAMLSDLLDKIR